MKPFKGNLRRCLDHLKHAIQGPKYLEKRQAVADFVGVGPQTVRRWLKGDMDPMGEPLIRTLFYLNHLGYRVTELEQLDRVILRVAQAFAFRLISLDEVARFTFFREGEGARSSILAIFRGVRGISDEKRALFQELANQYHTQLQERIDATPKVIAIEQMATTPEGVSQSASAPRPRLGRFVRVPSEHEAILQSLADATKAMTPLADIVSSDEFTPDERTKLHELAGDGTLFRLANRLYRLCSEKAREAHIQQQTAEGGEV